MSWVQAVVGVLVGLLVVWAVVLVVLWRAAPDDLTVRAALQLLPDIVRLVAALARDPEVPRRVRWMLVALGAYLVLPIDLVPDFVPVLGYADDAVLTVLVLRLVVSSAGRDALERNWSGDDASLRVVHRLVGLAEPRAD